MSTEMTVELPECLICKEELRFWRYINNNPVYKCPNCGKSYLIEVIMHPLRFKNSHPIRASPSRN